MNAIIENLLTRRSTRAFLQKEIPDNELTRSCRLPSMPQAVWASRPGSLRFSAIRKNPAAGRTHRTKTWTKGL